MLGVLEHLDRGGVVGALRRADREVEPHPAGAGGHAVDVAVELALEDVAAHPRWVVLVLEVELRAAHLEALRGEALRRPVAGPERGAVFGKRLAHVGGPALAHELGVEIILVPAGAQDDDLARRREHRLDHRPEPIRRLLALRGRRALVGPDQVVGEEEVEARPGPEAIEGACGHGRVLLRVALRAFHSPDRFGPLARHDAAGCPGEDLGERVTLDHRADRPAALERSGLGRGDDPDLEPAGRLPDPAREVVDRADRLAVTTGHQHDGPGVGGGKRVRLAQMRGEAQAGHVLGKRAVVAGREITHELSVRHGALTPGPNAGDEAAEGGRAARSSAQMRDRSRISSGVRPSSGCGAGVGDAASPAATADCARP